MNGKRYDVEFYTGHTWELISRHRDPDKADKAYQEAVSAYSKGAWGDTAPGRHFQVFTR